MKIRPILFSTSMVEAVLDESKTQTRRLKFEAEVGDILWVRETFQLTTWEHPLNENYGYIYKASENGRDWENNSEQWKWKPSIFMPKDACRIFLEVTNKIIEPLQSISKNDIYSEGVKVSNQLKLGGKNEPISFLPKGYLNGNTDTEIYALAHWASLWSKINGLKSWNENPKVKAYTFKVVDKPNSFNL